MNSEFKFVAEDNGQYSVHHATLGKIGYVFRNKARKWSAADEGGYEYFFSEESRSDAAEMLLYRVTRN